MKHTLVFALAVMCLLGSVAHAHHGGISVGTFSLPHAQGASTHKPLSEVFVSYQILQIDDDFGQLHTWTFGGEWAPHERLSVYGALPVNYVHAHGEADSKGLGDAIAGLKVGLLLARRVNLSLANHLILPTATDDSGLGIGQVGQHSALSIAVAMKRWLLIANSGISFAYLQAHEPFMLANAAIMAPEIAERLRFGLGTVAQVFISSESFDNGSWKMYLEPLAQLCLGAKERLMLVLSSRVSVADHLRLKSGLDEEDEHHAALSDVSWSLSSTIAFRF